MVFVSTPPRLNVATTDPGDGLRESHQGLMNNDEYRKAAKTAADWQDWLADRSHVGREPDRLEANVSLEDAFLDNLQNLPNISEL